jgi:hypothetical protein
MLVAMDVEHFSCHLRFLEASPLQISIVFSNCCKLPGAALSSLVKKGRSLPYFVETA